MFSEREDAIIKIIGKKSLTINQISQELYKTYSKPFDGEIAIGGAIIRIIRKCEINKLKWTLHKNKFGRRLFISMGKL